jgi:hypothetical protein
MAITMLVMYLNKPPELLFVFLAYLLPVIFGSDSGEFSEYAILGHRLAVH